MLANDRKSLIAGGGTAVWLSSGHLMRSLGADSLGAESAVVESRKIDNFGAGEGTLPRNRLALSTANGPLVGPMRRRGFASMGAAAA